ncbi:hypothetical protein POV27_06460 [Aureisphaera galaxeae]|uniref:hypothetical protein n=1 Tax=Aureisphaera galaxeae TaxID=1538023 RepID=UPI00234FFEE5|nr:hypothetical protein [Aureisphaera galaxeae]MDC8003685.1 hypothetical protein [Aureisphaera galaxeae]
MRALSFWTLFLSTFLVYSQSADHFDFWKNGKWESEITIYNNDTIPEKDSFIVRKLEGMNAFTENWKIFIGDGEYVDANVTRAFDKETNRWKLFYVDDLNAQLWDSQNVDGRLYFFKEFSYKGKKFYSRQTWIPQSDGSVVRIIERSEDNREWRIRYWQLFKLISP